MLDSELESFFSDASESNDDSFFSDGGSSCDEEMRKNNPPKKLEFPKVSPPSPEMPKKKMELRNIIEKPQKAALQRKSDTLFDVTENILSRQNRKKVESEVNNESNSNVPRKKLKKASTPIRNRISNLEKNADHKRSTLNKTYDIDLQRRRETHVRPNRVANSVGKYKLSFIITKIPLKLNLGDENDESPFEMTLAEDDRVDQKKRHRLFLEKFEKIQT